MNSLCLCTIFSCLFAVTTQQNRTAILPKHSDPPVKKSHPQFWATSSKERTFYIQSKNVWFIEIAQDGSIYGSKSESPAASILMESGGNQTVLMKGIVAEKYLCMDSNGRIYASDSPGSDCYFVEEYHNNNYNTYHHSFHRRGDKKNYLAIDNDGRVIVVNSKDVHTVYFLPFQPKVPNSSLKVTTTTTASPSTTTRAIPTTSTVAPNLIKLEKTRKRRRRWCKLLIRGKLEKNPRKYLDRCKHDCNILKAMSDNIRRYKRKCEKQRQRRRKRNRRRKHRTKGERIRHGSKRTRKHRGRGWGKKRTHVRATPSPQTHKVDVT